MIQDSIAGESGVGEVARAPQISISTSKLSHILLPTGLQIHSLFVFQLMLFTAFCLLSKKRPRHGISVLLQIPK